MTPAPAGLYAVEKPYGKDFAIVFRGTLSDCYLWIKSANYKRRKPEQYRVLDPEMKVVGMGVDGKSHSRGE